MKDSIAIIPARGGSKRIPGKNLRPFLGRPIIDYPIQICLTSGLFERVIVSTDSEAIALEAFKMGVESIQRSKSISGDSSPVTLTVLDALDFLSNRDVFPTYICVLFPTSVFVRKSELEIAKWAMTGIQRDGCISVTPLGVPIQRCLIPNPQGQLRMVDPGASLKMGQDLPPGFKDAAQFYWLRVSAFLKTRTLFPENVGVCVFPKYSVVDIDDDRDWQEAERKFR